MTEIRSSRGRGGAGVESPPSGSVPASLVRSDVASRGDAYISLCASVSGKSPLCGVAYGDGVENPDEGRRGDQVSATAMEVAAAIELTVLGLGGWTCCTTSDSMRCLRG